MKVGRIAQRRGDPAGREHIWILTPDPKVWKYTSACKMHVRSRAGIFNFRQFRTSLWDTRDRGMGFPQCKRCVAWRKKHGDAQATAEKLGEIDLSVFKVFNVP